MKPLSSCLSERSSILPQLPRTFCLTTLTLLLGCSATPPPAGSEHSQRYASQTTDWRQPAVHQNPGPWGSHEAVVTQTRQNITMYTYAVIEGLSGEEQEKALQVIQEIRDDIEKVEIACYDNKPMDLTSFFEWLKKINHWAIRQREYLVSR